MDLSDRRVERIRVLARSTDMGVPLPRVHPAFEVFRRAANLFGSQAEVGRGRQEPACFATFRFMFFPFSVDLANQLHEFPNFGARPFPARISAQPPNGRYLRFRRRTVRRVSDCDSAISVGYTE